MIRVLLVYFKSVEGVVNHVNKYCHCKGIERLTLKCTLKRMAHCQGKHNGQMDTEVLVVCTSIVNNYWMRFL